MSKARLTNRLSKLQQQEMLYSLRERNASGTGWKYDMLEISAMYKVSKSALGRFAHQHGIYRKPSYAPQNGNGNHQPELPLATSNAPQEQIKDGRDEIIRFQERIIIRLRAALLTLGKTPDDIKRILSDEISFTG